MGREDILDAARFCVCGDREKDYGSPESNLGMIACLWSVYTRHSISARDVAAMMVLMKVSRIRNGGGSGDSWVDIAGYAAIGGEVDEQGAKKGKGEGTAKQNGDSACSKA